MGLDWVLQPRAPTKKEERFKWLWQQIKQHDDDIEEYTKEMNQIGVSPFETIGCPQVGDSEETKQYYARRYYAKMRYPTVPLAEALEIRKDYVLLELCPTKEGFPEVVGMLAGPVDFRGKIIGRHEKLPKKLKER